MPSKRTLELLKGLEIPEFDLEFEVFGSGHFDREGEPITMGQWVVLHAMESYVRIDYSDIGLYYVSTVWLGLDHGWGEGPPIIFESMVFDNEVSHRAATEPSTSEDGIEWPGFPSYTYHEDRDQWRYTTEQVAREGHVELVALWRDRQATLSTTDPRDEALKEE